MTFIPLLSGAYLHLSRFFSTGSLVSLSSSIEIPASPHLVKVEIPTSNLKPSVTPTVNLTTVILFSYISCTSVLCATPNSLIQNHSYPLGTLSQAFSGSGVGKLFWLRGHIDF